MEQDYKKDLFEALGGEKALDGSFEEFVNTIDNNTEYQRMVFDELGGEKTFEGTFDEWSSTVFKKKENSRLEYSEEELQSRDVDEEQARLKQEESNYELSFNPQKPFSDNNKKFDYSNLLTSDVTDKVSDSFKNQVSIAVSKAERPIEFLNKANNIKKRISKLEEIYPDLDLSEIIEQSKNIDSKNIDNIIGSIEVLEKDISPTPNFSAVTPQTAAFVVNAADPSWEQYKSEAINDPLYLAIERLENDNDNLEFAANNKVGSEEKIEEVRNSFSDDELKTIDRIRSNPRLLMGVSDTDKETFERYQSKIGEAVTSEDVISARKNILRGAGKGLKSYVEGYSSLVNELKANSAVVDVVEKVENDEELNNEELLLVKAIYENAQKHAELDGKIPTSYKIGESLGHSLAFMGEFALTGGKQLGGKATKTIIKTAAKAPVGKKIAAGAMLKLASAGIQTAKMPSLYKGIAENVSNGESVGSAILNSAWETGAEVLSERLFMSNPSTGSASSAVEGIAQRMGLNLKADKGAVGLLKNMVEEAAEEKFNEIITAPKNYDDFGDFWRGFTDEESNKVMLGSVALMTGILGSPAVIGSTIEDTKRKVLSRRIEKYVPADLREEIRIIADDKQLSVAEQYELIESTITDRVNDKELGGDPAKTAANAMRFAQFRIEQNQSENTTKNARVENDEVSISEKDAPSAPQESIDYLVANGIDPNGMSLEDVNSEIDKINKEKQPAPASIKTQKELYYDDIKSALSDAGINTKNKSYKELDDLYSEYEAEKKESRIELRKKIDEEIASSQKRLGLPETPDVEVSEDAQETLDKIDNNEPVVNEFLQRASSELKTKIDDLRVIEKSDSRVYTSEQINKMIDVIGEEITKIEEYERLQTERNEFVTEIENREASAKRKRELNDRISEIEKRKKEIDTEIVNGVDESRRQELDSEFIALNKEKSKITEEIKNVEEKVQIEQIQEQGEQIKPKETVVEAKQGIETEASESKAKSKEDARKARYEEIDKELGNEIEDLIRSIGGLTDIVGENRKKIVDSAIKISKLLAEKYSMKIEDAISEAVLYLKAKKINISDSEITEITKKTKQYAQENGESTKEGVQEEKAKKERVQRPSVRDYEKNGVEAEKKKEKTVTTKTRQGNTDKTQEKSGGIYEEMVKKKPYYYKQRSNEKGFQDALAWLNERTEEENYVSLSKRHPISAAWVERRSLFLVYLGQKMDQLLESGELAKAKIVDEQYQKIRTELAKDNTAAGRAIQTNAQWASLTTRSIDFIITQHIAKINEEKLSGVDSRSINSNNLFELSEDIGKEITENKNVNNKIEEVSKKYKKAKVTNSERAKSVAENIRKIKSSNWGITFAADPISAVGIGVLDGALEVTAKAIEASGNVADAIEKGLKYIRKSDWYKSLTSDKKRKIDRKFSFKVRESAGVEKMSKKEAETYLRQETGDIKSSLEKLIKDYWGSINSLGEKLSERIEKDLGIKKADAKEIEQAVQSVINDKIETKFKEHIGADVLPKDTTKKKTFLNKFAEVLGRGNLEYSIFTETFAEAFGLESNLTKKQIDYLGRLHDLVVKTQDMGAFGDITSDAFTKEFDSLIPETKTRRLLNAVIGLNYANILMGPTTWYVNIKSAAANIIVNPILNIVNPAKWASTIRDSKENHTWLINNPVTSLMASWAFWGTGVVNSGFNEILNILRSGDLRGMNKYISEVNYRSNIKIPELERQLHGKQRFKPFTIFGKKIYNPTNIAKYSGRFLAAQDALMFEGFNHAIMAEKLSKKMAKEGATNKQIYNQIMREVAGYNLTENEEISVDKQLSRELEQLSKFGINPTSRQITKRRMEIIRATVGILNETDLIDVREAARDQIYTSDRGGIVNTMMGSLSRFSNKNLLNKFLTVGHFKFFKIFANIGDMSIDTIPGYGIMRTIGYSPSTMYATFLYHKNNGASHYKAIGEAIFGKRINPSKLPFLTAQLGDKGSAVREKQMERAVNGTTAMIIPTLIILGMMSPGDDDEPFLDVSFGRFDIKDPSQRHNPADGMPPYTIKVGKLKLKYNSIPAIMFSVGMIGAYRDMQRMGMNDEDMSNRLKMMQKGMLMSLFSLTELNIAGGFKDIAKFTEEVIVYNEALKEGEKEELAGRKRLQKVAKLLIKKQGDPLTGWLPTKNNFLQQMFQFADPEKVESKGVAATLMYNLGIHKFTNLSALDIYGEEIESYPGYTNISYVPLMQKNRPDTWDLHVKLSNARAVPSTPYNMSQMVIGNNGEYTNGESYEYILPDDKEFWLFRKLAGQKFKEQAIKYTDSEAFEKDNEISAGNINKDMTLAQKKVAAYWIEAKAQTRDYLFTWSEFSRENPEMFKRLYENNSIPSKISTLKVPKLDGIEPRLDENDNFIVEDEINLSKSDLFMANKIAMDRFIELQESMDIPEEVLKEVSSTNWKEAIKYAEIEMAKMLQ